MKAWIRQPKSDQILGPLSTQELSDGLANGTVSDDMIAIEDTGQTFPQLRASEDWVSLKQLFERQAGKRGPLRADSAEGPTSSVTVKSPVVARYRDAYRVGSGIVAIGNTIKVVGAVVGGLALLISLNLGSFALGGVLLGGISGGLFWVCGVIVNSHGQTLIATLDTAVASSRFLSDEECAETMGLPSSILTKSTRKC